MLKKAIDVKGEIVIAGVLNKIEIWPKEKYHAELDELLNRKGHDSELAKMTEEAFALLEEEDEAHIPVFE
ncbi:MAG: hypothetical protein K1000chlam2_01476 [Chlamydiae bacterium]|nr:hypothetical protein [Chlamydiota bacterium]